MCSLFPSLWQFTFCYHFGFQSFAVNNFPIADILDIFFFLLFSESDMLLSKFFGICLNMYSYLALIRNVPALHSLIVNSVLVFVYVTCFFCLLFRITLPHRLTHPSLPCLFLYLLLQLKIWKCISKLLHCILSCIQYVYLLFS